MQRFLILGTGGSSGFTYVPDPTEQRAPIVNSVYVDDFVAAGRIDEGLGDVENAALGTSIVIETP